MVPAPTTKQTPLVRIQWSRNASPAETTWTGRTFVIIECQAFIDSLLMSQSRGRAQDVRGCLFPVLEGIQITPTRSENANGHLHLTAQDDHERTSIRESLASVPQPTQRLISKEAI